MPRHVRQIKQGKHDMTYTLKEAIKLKGVPAERTLLRHHTNGELSMDKDKKGRWIIQGSELVRRYNIQIDPQTNDLEHDNDKTYDTPRHDTHNDMSKKSNNDNLIQKYANDLVEDLRHQISKYETREKEWNAQIERRDEKEQNLITELSKANARLLTYQEDTDKPPQKPVEGKKKNYPKDVGKNENKASAGHVWAIIALFLIVACAASAVGYYFSELKPQALLESQVSIADSPKKPSEAPVFIPKTPLNFTPSPNN
jgi:hypothetical protein